MLNNEQLAAIRERADKAPFELVPVGPENSSDLYALTGQEVEWINSAREDVPKLLNEVERLRKALEGARTACLPEYRNNVQDLNCVLDWILQTTREALEGK